MEYKKNWNRTKNIKTKEKVKIDKTAFSLHFQFDKWKELTLHFLGKTTSDERTTLLLNAVYLNKKSDIAEIQ